MDLSVFTPTDDLDVETLHVGSEHQPVLKVDGLFQGIDIIRNYAISRNQFSAADSFYPGLRMEIPHEYSLAVLHSLAIFIQNFFRLDLTKIRKVASRYSIVTKPADELSLLQRIPHFDAPNPRSLAMVYYLCDAPDSGTALYRHRASGYEYIDEERYTPYMEMVRQQFSSLDQQPQGYIYKSTDTYEQIAAYKAKYNRLIAYHGSSLHSGIILPSYQFDPSPTTGRLTVTSFIEFD